jgi:hypothetical protein
MDFVEPDEKREPDWDPDGSRQGAWENRPLPEWCYRILEKRTNWDCFETYKGPEERERLPAWCYRVIDGFMIMLAAAIIFAISGGLVYLVSSRFAGEALAETPGIALIKFCTGGCLGLGWALSVYFRKKRPLI